MCTELKWELFWDRPLSSILSVPLSDRVGVMLSVVESCFWIQATLPSPCSCVRSLGNKASLSPIPSTMLRGGLDFEYCFLNIQLRLRLPGPGTTERVAFSKPGDDFNPGHRFPYCCVSNVIIGIESSTVPSVGIRAAQLLSSASLRLQAVI
jgi:hypothetical protein